MSCRMRHAKKIWLDGWLFFFINVDLAIFQPYLDLEAGDNQSLKIQVARRGIEPRSSCSASQELNHSATTAPKYGLNLRVITTLHVSSLEGCSSYCVKMIPSIYIIISMDSYSFANQVNYILDMTLKYNYDLLFHLW